MACEPFPVNQRDMKRLIRETGADKRSVLRWVNGEDVFETTAYALGMGCISLNIKLPAEAYVPASVKAAERG